MAGSIAFSKVSGATTRSALAGSALTPTPSRVPVAVLVVLVNAPADAPAGTRTGTTTVHESPAARFPPVSVTTDVPLICEPVPQTSAAGRPSATKPVSAASRSSLSPISVNGNAEPLVIDSSRFTRPAGSTGVVWNDLVRTKSPDTTS